MFRAEIRWLANGPVLKMEGRLVAGWSEQARLLVTNQVVPKSLVVDLTELSYIDCAGEQLLNWLASLGAKFLAGNLYALSVCAHLHLPVL
jgi:anti-anti-sigma regulatory factor